LGAAVGESQRDLPAGAALGVVDGLRLVDVAALDLGRAEQVLLPLPRRVLAAGHGALGGLDALAGVDALGGLRAVERGVLGLDAAVVLAGAARGGGGARGGGRAGRRVRLQRLGDGAAL